VVRVWHAGCCPRRRKSLRGNDLRQITSANRVPYCEGIQKNPARFGRGSFERPAYPYAAKDTASRSTWRTCGALLARRICSMPVR